MFVPSSKLNGMKTKKEVADHINSFVRPEGYNTAAWFTLKKWAGAVWDSKLASQTWQYTLKVSCKEFYDMLCDSKGECIISDLRLLKFEQNRYTKKWFFQLLEESTAFAKEGEYEEALRLINIAVEIQPKSTEAWNNKAVILKELKQYKSAFGAFSRALFINRNTARVYVNRAELFMEVEWYQKALEDLNSAVELEGTQKYIEQLKSLALWKSKKQRQAINNWKCALHYYQANEADWTLLAKWQLAIGDLKEARLSYRKVLSLNPFYADALYGKGLLEIQENPESKTGLEAIEMAHLLGHQSAGEVLMSKQ